MKTSFKFSSPFIEPNINNSDIFNNNDRVFNIIDNAPYELSIIYAILSYEKEKIKGKIQNGNY